jgi:superfamily II DNA/RNA helicase
MPCSKQVNVICKATAILVATTCCHINLLNEGEIQLAQLQIKDLNEAHLMADIGFLSFVKETLDHAKPDELRLFLSTTLDRGVDSLVKQYLKIPKLHFLQNNSAFVSTMEN